ncbi:MAG: RNA-binding S4 domain-containing protein [Candidatus Altiarchaeota archaeon]|nr:RNA-binding S4 domain-containing protein [Candidatus Altiarchaeota archaeon]
MHTKRLAVGKGKGIKWVITPRGPHKNAESITLTEVLKKLGYADTTPEAKKILSNGEVLVDGGKIKDHKYAVGLMDTISVPKMKKAYIVSTSKHRLILVEVKTAKTKICKVIGKKIMPKGKIQVNLHDGTNALYDKPVKVNDTVVLELPSRKIHEVIPYDTGSKVLIVSGRHRGQQGEIKEILSGTASRDSLTTVGDLQTLTDYVFVVGKDKPLVDLA